MAYFFGHDPSESSPTEPAASDAEEQPDLNLNLCISLPSNSPAVANRPSSLEVSNSTSVGGLIIPEILEGRRNDEKKSEQ